MLELVFHKVHIGCYSLKYLLKALTHIVKSTLTHLCLKEAILGTSTIAGKEPLTASALLGQSIHFISAEVVLLIAVHQFADGGLMYIAQQIFGRDEMVTSI
jgi:hypothetical protein